MYILFLVFLEKEENSIIDEYIYIYIYINTECVSFSLDSDIV